MCKNITETLSRTLESKKSIVLFTEVYGQSSTNQVPYIITWGLQAYTSNIAQSMAFLNTELKKIKLTAYSLKVEMKPGE